MKCIVKLLQVISPLFFGMLYANQPYQDIFENKVICITGGTGFLGQALVERILPLNPKQVIIFSRDEVKHYKMLQEFNDPRLKSILGDTRNVKTLSKAFAGVDIVIHAAALKRLDILEDNIFESIQTNLLATKNVIDAAVSNDVKTVLFISTDKACSPANTYGACKYISEKMFTNYASKLKTNRFVTVRYGNVLESTGSVIPFFCDRIRKKMPVPLTDERMTRFFIAKQQAVDLIFKALRYGVGGEIFIPILPAFKIVDLITVLQEKIGYDNGISLIGLRPGEKIHELMISSTEAPRTYKIQDMYVILPSIKLPHKVNAYQKYTVPITSLGIEEYSSGDEIFSKEDLANILDTYAINLEAKNYRTQDDFLEIDACVQKPL